MSYDIFSMCFWGTGQVNDQVLESLLMFHLGHPNIFDNSYDFIFLSLEWIFKWHRWRRYTTRMKMFISVLSALWHEVSTLKERKIAIWL